MKLTVFIVACMAIVAVQTASVQNDPEIDGKAFLEKQRFLFQILYRVDHPLILEEWIKLGGKLIVDKSLYSKYDEYMVKFYNAYKLGRLLPQGEFFSVMQRTHIIQAAGLFNFFYNAKDWDTLVQNIAWARMNVNEGMFVYALSMATIHRSDMQGLILPQIYEIFPQMFLSSKLIIEAEKFDWDVFNRQIMLEKEFHSIYLQEQVGDIFGNRFYQMDWKLWQWWKLMGLDDGFQLEGKYPLREGIQLLEKDPMWSSIYSNLKMAYMPVDYTRDIEIYNDDSMLSYFTEDVDLNAFWYYLNLDYSKILPIEGFDLDKDRRGEVWLYTIQNILARYDMERLSNGLGSIDMMNWQGYVYSGYNPQLVSYSGSSFSVRKNYWQIESNHNQDLLNRLISLENRIIDMINSKRFVMTNGTVLDLSQPSAVEIIGATLQSNYYVLGDDWYFLGGWWYLANIFLSSEEKHDFTVAPNVLLNYETMLRDPLTYRLFKTVFNIFQLFKYQFPSYKREELLLPGVKILDVQASKMVTYFDLVDVDVSTLLNDKMNYQDGKLVMDEVLLARQLRLNHEQFTIDLFVDSIAIQKVVVRMYLAPLFDQYGQKIDMFVKRENFMQLDAFPYDLVVGNNTIHRSSEDIQWSAGDKFTYTELYNYLMMSYDGKYKFEQKISSAHSLFPDRLILPRGWPEGMPMALFFMISPYTAYSEQYSTYDPTWQAGLGSGVRHIDSSPFGYPLDRKIDDLMEFFVPNMFVKNVKIYHSEKYDKYFPLKYEHYGNFDYNY